MLICSCHKGGKVGAGAGDNYVVFIWCIDFYRVKDTAKHILPGAAISGIGRMVLLRIFAIHDYYVSQATPARFADCGGALMSGLTPVYR